MLPTRELSLALALVLVASICVCRAHGDQVKESTGDEQQQQLQQSQVLIESGNSGRQAGSLSSIRANSRLLAVPHSLARFLFYNSRGPSERQAQAAFAPEASSPNGYKRSSSQLDALNGVTLGKRSAPTDFVNFEPVFGRQALARSPSRFYDMRWAPSDSAFEGAASNEVSDY